MADKIKAETCSVFLETESEGIQGKVCEDGFLLLF